MWHPCYQNSGWIPIPYPRHPNIRRQCKFFFGLLCTKESRPCYTAFWLLCLFNACVYQTLIFPAASSYTREGTPSSDYFQGIQSFSVPITTSTATTAAPTSTAAPVYSFTATTQAPVYQTQQVIAYENCDEQIFFKLYCPQNPDGSFTSGCFMIHTFSTNAPHCSGTVQLCENGQASPPVARRLGGKSVN